MTNPSHPISDRPDLPLKVEVEYFNQNRAAWIAQGHEGQWATVKVRELLGFYPDVDSAYAAGASKFGAVPFLVKQVRARDDIAIIHRSAPHRRAQ